MRRGLMRIAFPAALGTVLAASALAGCNSAARPDERISSEQTLDRQQTSPFASDRNGDEIDRGATPLEDRDYLMGRNANPNLIIGHYNVNNKGVHIRQMTAAAKSVAGVENARITLSGANAYVTLDLAPNITAGQAREIERQVIAALRQKAPRYDFHITSNDGYHR